MSKSSINIALLIIFALVFFRVLLGPWGWIGAGDATLYQQVSACVEAPEQSVARTCFSPDDTSSMLPVAVVGFSAKLFGADSVRVMLRLWSALLAVFALFLVFHLARSKSRPQDGFAALFLLLFGTPLLERASSGAPEVWTFALLLAMAWLLGQTQRKSLFAILAIGLSLLLVTSHSYAAPVLLLVLFVSIFESRSLGPRVIGGRVWFGWVGARFLCAAVGGTALFVIFWPGADGSAGLWSHLTEVYSNQHPPILLGGKPWVQGVQYGGPPWSATLVWVFLSVPLLVLFLILMGLGDQVRRIGPRIGPSGIALLLFAFGWWLITCLQGSPVADGQDHRLILLGLLIPFAGRAFRWIESLVDWWLSKRSEDTGSVRRLGRIRSSLIIFAIMLAPSLDTFWSATPPTSLLVGQRSGYLRYGISPFARPEIHPDWFKDHAEGSVGCQPWASLCEKELLPALAVIGSLPRDHIALSGKKRRVLVVPKDPTYPEQLDAALKVGTPTDRLGENPWVEVRVLQP